MNKKIVIIGASGHGKVVANIAKLNGYEHIVFLDDDVNIKSCGSYKIVGNSEKINSLIEEGFEFFVGIGDNKIREKIYLELVNKRAIIPSLIHPDAIIDESVQIEQGTVIMANVVINADSVIKEGCILNTAATIDHDCVINGFVHISPGVHLAGAVEIGKKTWIGIGAHIINNLTICSECLIGAGSTVIENIKNKGIYIGNPAKLK